MLDAYKNIFIISSFVYKVQTIHQPIWEYGVKFKTFKPKILNLRMDEGPVI